MIVVRGFVLIASALLLVPWGVGLYLLEQEHASFWAVALVSVPALFFIVSGIIALEETS